MGIFSGLFSSDPAPRNRVEPTFRAASPENPATPLSNPDAWLLDWSNGGVPLFGPPVNEQTAMAVSTVFRCVSLMSGLFAGLPLKIYRDDPVKGRQIVEPDFKDPIHGDGMRFLARLLGQVPYPGRPLTSFAWRELWGINILLWGNHYSIIRYNNAGRVTGFEPVMPWDVEVFRLANGQNAYKVTWPGERYEMVPQDEMLHFVGPGFNGIKGSSRIQAFARNAVALARTLEEQSGRVHENAARPSGMVTVPQNISPDGLRRMEAYFNERYAGRLNSGKIVFADKDSTFTPFQMTAEDLQTIESRRYTSADICRFFGVPPHMAFEAAGTSAWGSGIEQLTIGFKVYDLEREFQRIEHEINYKLLDQTPYYAMFDREAMAAMDAVAHAQALQTQVNSGLLTPNEGRRKLNRPAMPDGDELFVNSTMIPISRAVNPPAPPAPAPGGGKEPSQPAKPGKGDGKDGGNAT